MTQFASLVLFSDRPERTAAFYRALGVQLEDEDHGDGAVHFAADVDGVHFAVLDAEAAGQRGPAWRQGGCTFPGFYVESLDKVLHAVTALGVPVVHPHQTREWGCRTVVQDPDGRHIELNQRGHCAGVVPER